MMAKQLLFQQRLSVCLTVTVRPRENRRKTASQKLITWENFYGEPYRSDYTFVTFGLTGVTARMHDATPPSARGACRLFR